MPKGIPRNGKNKGWFKKGEKKHPNWFAYKGEKHPCWKGNNVSYVQIHRWLINSYGKATKCENSKCVYQNPKRYDWALIQGMKYEKNRDNFIMLCPSCHKKYDSKIYKYTCLQCGDRGVGKSKKRKFCSIKCTSAYHRSEGKEVEISRESAIALNLITIK